MTFQFLFLFSFNIIFDINYPRVLNDLSIGVNEPGGKSLTTLVSDLGSSMLDSTATLANASQEIMTIIVLFSLNIYLPNNKLCV